MQEKLEKIKTSNYFIRLKHIVDGIVHCEDYNIHRGQLEELKVQFINEVGKKLLYLVDIKDDCQKNDISEVELDLDIIIIKYKNFKKFIDEFIKEREKVKLKEK